MGRQEEPTEKMWAKLGLSCDTVAVVWIWASLVVLGLAIMLEVVGSPGEVFRSLLCGLMLFSWNSGKFLWEGVVTEDASPDAQALLLPAFHGVRPQHVLPP